MPSKKAMMFSHGDCGGMSQPEEGMKFRWDAHRCIRARVAALTDSQLGALGELIVNAKFSRDMETEADDYGYNYLCEAGKNPWAMVRSFEKMEQLSGSTGQQGGITNLGSSHPDTQKRIEHISQRCLNDGYKR